MIEDIKNFNELDSLVFASPDGTIFHSSFWLKNSTSTFAKLGYYENNKLLMALIFEIDGKKGKLSSLAPYLGFVSDSSLLSSRKEKIEKIILEYINKNFENITFFTSPKHCNLSSLLFNGFDAKLHYTNVIELNRNIIDIYNNFSKNIKRNIIKATREKLNVKIEYSTENLLKFIKMTFDRQEKDTWFNLREVYSCIEQLIFHSYSVIFTTYKDSEPIASVCIVWDTNTAYYILGGYHTFKKHNSSVTIAMWEAIKFSCKLGLDYFDFEGSRIENINNYFKQFGSKKIPYYQIIKFTDTITVY